MMMPTGLENSLLRAGGRAAAYLGRRALTARQQRQLAEEVRTLLAHKSASALLDGLPPQESRALLEFTDSAEFEEIVLRVVVWSVTGTKEGSAVELRNDVRTGLLQRGIDPERQLQLTDFLFALVKREAAAARDKLGSGRQWEQFGVSVAADLAAARARKDELLERVRSVAEFHEVAASFRRQVAALRSDMTLIHLGGRMRFSYDRLYVTPTFSDDANPAVTIEEILVDRRRAVILGDPGAGKSTFAAKLARDLAVDEPPTVGGQVPVLFITRDHNEKIIGGDYVLAELLQVAMRHPYNVKISEEGLEYLLLTGAVTVIVDGIDEIGELHHRRRFAESVEGFAHLYPQVRIIVTSRGIGYEDAALDDTLFPVVWVPPFTDKQVAEYARSWFHLDNAVPEKQRVRLVQGFLIDSVTVADLRANPLMLSLLCSLYLAEHAIPRDRAEVYEKCAKLLFQEWDKHRGLAVSAPYRSHLRPAVAALAWRIYDDAKGRQALPRSEVHAFLTDYLMKRRFSEEAEAMRASDDLLDFCAGRAWVLTEVGSGAREPWYGFTHRTFLEYFTAVQLVRRDPTPEGVWDELRKRPLDSSWNLVAQLALQIVNEQNDDGADRVLALSLDEHDTWLEFAARSLQSVIPSSKTLGWIAKESFESCVNGPQYGRRMRYQVFEAPGEYDRGDLPLRLILESALPENASRARGEIKRSLEEIITKLPARSDGDRVGPQLICEALTYKYSAASIRQGIGVIPPIKLGDEAQRALHHFPSLFAPNSRSVAEHGVSLLFSSVSLLREHLPSYASQLLAAALIGSSPNARREAAARELEALYGHLIASPWPWLRRREDDEAMWIPAVEWGRLGRTCDPQAMVGKLSRQARGAAVLLMLPMWQGESNRTTSGVFGAVAEARYDPPARARAHSTVAEWYLPDEAEALVDSWIERLDSPIVGYR
ncbi:NACHT domain-containing protein [Verrucosispora sp. WMMC514]|uniref:NACHT domain-containing protein n=1 Tax=Verrucosispora sp. WMMC514 TaxID=3015156 RepID=UPI00248C4A56|nr:NACHT domain-containing protein [Verrucosispora sp. WMMC514]WBB91433.1 NACHT domain-containing protein [Verrucosispora sp. WMMC514]